MKNKEIIYIGGAVVSLIVVFLIVKKIKDKSEAGKVRTGQRAEKLENKALVVDPNVFNTNYTSIPSSKLLSPDILEDIAKDLKKSFKDRIFQGTGTNEPLFFASLDRIKTLAQLAQIKDYYRNRYNDDLQTKILSELTKNEEQRFAAFLKNLK